MTAAGGIAAIVVTHRSAETIDACLSRLRAAEGVACVRVVDNASDDGTLDIVQRHALADPRVRFIANPDNPGFGAACNQGVADLGAASPDAASPDAAGSDAAGPAKGTDAKGTDAKGAGAEAGWLAFVNPDALLDADALARLRAHAQHCAREALLGADLVDESGVRDEAARRRDPDFAAMLLRPSTRRLGVPVDASAILQPVQAISGALMLMPRHLFARLGGFDAGYRLHAEDLDLCRRARDAGAFVAVANDVRVVHVRGVSSRSRPLFVEWHKHRGLARYFRRFEAPRRPALVCAAVYAMIWARFPVAALRARVLAR